jgi:DASS family divalent anion:Na+ symporter
MECKQKSGEGWIAYLKYGVAVLSIFAGVAIALMPPPEGLTPEAMRAIGVLVFAVGWWICQIVPEYVTGILMCTLWAATHSVKFNVAFSTFAGTGWWMMVGAFALGAVAGRTGLLRRISLYVLTLFPATFRGQVLGLMGAGTIISPLVPSMNAKSALSAPLALAISDSLGAERKSPAASGLLAACYTGFVLMGHIFLSGSFSHYMLISILPEQYKNVSWFDWFLWALPWGVVAFAGLALYIFWAYAPKEKLSLPKGYGRKELDKIGPMSRDEKIVLAVILAALTGWMTSFLHHVSGAVIAVMAMCILLGVKTMTKEDFKTRIEWPAIFLIGCVFNMAKVVKALHIDVWLTGVLKPIMGLVMSSTPVMIISIVVVIIMIRFLITNMTSGSIIVAIVMMPSVLAAGINPWIVIFIAFTAANLFFFKYMNTIYLCAQFTTHGEMSDHWPMAKFCMAFTVVSTIGFLVSVPFWKMFGLM